MPGEKWLSRFSGGLVCGELNLRPSGKIVVKFRAYRRTTIEQPCCESISLLSVDRWVTLLPISYAFRSENLLSTGILNWMIIDLVGVQCVFVVHIR